MEALNRTKTREKESCGERAREKETWTMFEGRGLARLEEKLSGFSNRRCAATSHHLRKSPFLGARQGSASIARLYGFGAERHSRRDTSNRTHTAFANMSERKEIKPEMRMVVFHATRDSLSQRFAVLARVRFLLSEAQGNIRVMPPSRTSRRITYAPTKLRANHFCQSQILCFISQMVDFFSFAVEHLHLSLLTSLLSTSEQCTNSGETLTCGYNESMPALARLTQASLAIAISAKSDENSEKAVRVPEQPYNVRVSLSTKHFLWHYDLLFVRIPSQSNFSR